MFQAFTSGGYTYRRIGHRSPIRVRTFVGRGSAALFAAGFVGTASLCARDDDLGDVLIVADDLQPTMRGRKYVAQLLSDDEAKLLQFFGVDLRKYASP